MGPLAVSVLHEDRRGCRNGHTFHRMIILCWGFSTKYSLVYIHGNKHDMISSFLLKLVNLSNKYILWFKVHLNQINWLLIAHEQFLGYLWSLVCRLSIKNISDARLYWIWSNTMWRVCPISYLYKISNFWCHRNKVLTYATGGIEIVAFSTIFILRFYWFFQIHLPHRLHDVLAVGITLFYCSKPEFTFCLTRQK
jgi:hypothetical protein